MNLHEHVEQFTEKWGPARTEPKEKWTQFLIDLRGLLLHYGSETLKHGAQPEKGVPHGWPEGKSIKPPLPPWIEKHCVECLGAGQDCDHDVLRARIVTMLSVKVVSQPPQK